MRHIYATINLLVIELLFYVQYVLHNMSSTVFPAQYVFHYMSSVVCLLHYFFHSMSSTVCPPQYVLHSFSSISSTVYILQHVLLDCLWWWKCTRWPCINMIMKCTKTILWKVLHVRVEYVCVKDRSQTSRMFQLDRKQHQSFLGQTATWGSLQTTLLWSLEALWQVNLIHRNVSTLWSPACLPVFCESEEFNVYLSKCSPTLLWLDRKLAVLLFQGCRLSDSCCGPTMSSSWGVVNIQSSF